MFLCWLGLARAGLHQDIEDHRVRCPIFAPEVLCGCSYCTRKPLTLVEWALVPKEFLLLVEAVAGGMVEWSHLLYLTSWQMSCCCLQGGEGKGQCCGERSTVRMYHRANLVLLLMHIHCAPLLLLPTSSSDSPAWRSGKRPCPTMLSATELMNLFPELMPSR